ncbi:MAG: hypothetical protein ACHP91_00895 [Burkholderiales bacterium]
MRNVDDFIYRDGGAQLTLALAPIDAGHAAAFAVTLVMDRRRRKAALPGAMSPARQARAFPQSSGNQSQAPTSSQLC